MSRRVSLNTCALLHKSIMLSCGLRDVILHISVRSECQCWLGIEVEPKEGYDDDLVEYECANDQEYKPAELKPVEVLLFAIDLEDEEEDPYYKGSRRIYGRSLC